MVAAIVPEAVHGPGNLPEFVAAVHASEATEALTYVKDANVVPHCQT